MIGIEREGAVATVVVDRADALNALDVATLTELRDRLVELRDDAGVRAVVLTGAGDRAFIAGADIKAMSAMDVGQAKAWGGLGHEAARLLEEMPKPTIAAINGFALGGGCELALACDIRYASSKAKLGQPEINLGIIPGFGGTQRLARRIGAPRAREMIYGGDMIDAETARQWGLVNRVVKPEELLGEARKLAAAFAAKPPVAIAQAKLAIRHGLDVDLESGLRLEAEAFAVTFSTTDRSEGMTAFLSTRPAKFTGR